MHFCNLLRNEISYEDNLRNKWRYLMTATLVHRKKISDTFTQDDCPTQGRGGTDDNEAYEQSDK
jgi:hypothetical protein